MTSSQTNLDIAGRITRSLTSSQAGPRTDGGKMADLTPDFQSFVRESLTLLISVPAELKSVKDSVDSLIKDKSEMQSYMHTLSEDLKDMKASLDEYKKEVTTLKAEINQARKCNQSLAAENIEIKEEKLKLETYLRRQNLVIEGVNESENEDVQNKVTNLLADKCKIVLRAIEIDKIHRYGKSVAGRPRPIIIRFMSHSSRDRILFTYRGLKDKPSNLFVNEDLPYEIKTRRADVRAVANQAKSVGARVKLQGDRVVIDSKVYTFNTLKHVPAKYSLESARTVRVNEDTTAFYSKYAILSNFYPANFSVDGVTYSSIEQLFQCKKVMAAGRDDLASRIMNETDCVIMKRLGDSLHPPHGSTWESDKLEIMKLAVYEKFRQNPQLQDALLTTGNTTLVEATRDFFWGAGDTTNSIEVRTKTWKGRNHLGEILMNVRGNLTKRN